jgi:DNA-binding transcriptional regulator YdaS (Cro superfamily)
MPTLYARTLKRAAEITGGTEALALRLKVVPSHLTLWILGAEPTPPDVFLKAVDLISEHDGLKNLPT